MIFREKSDNIKSINASTYNPIEKVFSIEKLLYDISNFLTFEEIKKLYSINKRLNAKFRAFCKVIKSKAIIQSSKIRERFQNLKILEISPGKPVNLNILKELKKLEILKIKGFHYIDDDTCFSELKELKTLHLVGNKITNISFIKNLSNISILDLGSNKLNDISYLTQLSSLKFLSLQDCGITNLNVNILHHKNFSKLERLYIGMNTFTDYSFLKNLQNLKTLNIYHNNISSIDFIDLLNKEKLNALNLGENERINNYSFLFNLTNLKKLSLYRNNIQNIDFLDEKCFSNIEVLDLGYNFHQFMIDGINAIQSLNYNPLSYLKPLTNLKKLKVLKMFYCYLENIDFLNNENFKFLEYIELGHNQIKDFAPLSHFKNLKYISVIDNPIYYSDWLKNNQFHETLTELIIGRITIHTPDFLKDYKHLINLNLYECNIDNISFLNWDIFSELKKLNLGQNEIEDASPVRNLKKLKILNLSINKIKDISFLNDENCIIEELNLARNYIKDFSALLKLKRLEIINIDRQKEVPKKDNEGFLLYEEEIQLNLEEQRIFYDIILKIKENVRKISYKQDFIEDLKKMI